MRNDKTIMEDLLQTTKGACELYMHGAIESNTQSVHGAFDEALNQSLCMQQSIYGQMAQNGWYPAEQAQPQQIDKVRQKFVGVQ